MRLSEIDRGARQHQAIAFTALGLSNELFVGYAIDSETMRAGEMHDFSGFRGRDSGFKEKRYFSYIEDGHAGKNFNPPES